MRIGPANANSYVLKLPGVSRREAAPALRVVGRPESAGSGDPRTAADLRATGAGAASGEVRISVRSLLGDLRQLVAAAPNQAASIQGPLTNAAAPTGAGLATLGRRASQGARTTSRNVVSGLNGLQVAGAFVAGLSAGARATLSGQVTRAATGASLTVIGGADATLTAGGDHTLLGALGSATLELTAGQSLFEVAELINERVEQTGVTASVLGNDLVLTSSEVGASAIVGLAPVDGPDLSIAGVNGNQVEAFEVSGFASGETETISGSLVSAAEGAELVYQGAAGGLVAGTASFRLSGSRGAADVSIVEGESLAAVAGRINQDSESMGVIATVSGNDLLLASDTRGAAASVQIDSIRPEYSQSVSGIDPAEVVDFSVVALAEGSEHTLSGEVLQAATQAELTLQGGAQATVIDSATFEVRGAVGTATISIVQGEALADVATRVNAEADVTGVVAAVEGTSLVLRSMAVGSAAEVNVELIDITHTIEVSGVNTQQLTAFQVNSFDNGASQTISGSVTQTAGQAELTFTGSLGFVGTNATFTLSGSQGSVQLSVSSFQGLNSLVTQVNANTGTTGVAAVREGNQVKLQSVGVGSSATVAVAVSSGSFQTTGGNGNGTANGTNAAAIVNGQTITGAGNDFQFSDAVGGYSFTSAAGFTGDFSTVSIESVAGSFDLVGGDGNGAATGLDAVTEINEVQLTGVGDRFVVETAGGEFELEFAAGFEGPFAPITVRSVAAAFEISGGDGAGTDFGADGIAFINGSELTSADDRFVVQGEHGAYVIQFTTGFTGEFDPITVSTPELSLVGADAEGTAYGADAEAIVNGQQLVGDRSRFSFSENGRQVTIEFQTGFVGEFDPITVTRRERVTGGEDEQRQMRGGNGEDPVAVDASVFAAEGLLDEVDRLLALTDGSDRVAGEELENEGDEPVEVISRAEIVRSQFEAIAKDGYFAGGTLAADWRLAQLKGLVDLLA